MDIPASAYAAIGATSAAIIAGGISFIITVLAKDQKTSEFRQAWIDELRNDISELISIISILTDIFRIMAREGKKQSEIIDYFIGKEGHFCKLEMVSARIKLRVNPSEHTKFLNTLSSLRKYCNPSQVHDSKLADTLIDELVKESQLILKQEWKRVKRGEPVFIATKLVSLLLLVVALFIGAAYALEYLHIGLLP